LTKKDKLGDDGDEEPKPRNSHGMVFDPKSKNYYIYGGANVEGPIGDMFSLDGKKFIRKN
jgi:hypothetical protein